MEDLYTNTVSCVQADGVQSDWFSFSAGVRQGCNIAPDLFLEPMDWVMDRTVHRGFAGISIGSQVFTDLDFADDVAVLSEMLEILILSLEIMYYDTRPDPTHIWTERVTRDPTRPGSMPLRRSAKPIIFDKK